MDANGAVKDTGFEYQPQDDYLQDYNIDTNNQGCLPPLGSAKMIQSNPATKPPMMGIKKRANETTPSNTANELPTICRKTPAPIPAMMARISRPRKYPPPARSAVRSRNPIGSLYFSGVLTCSQLMIRLPSRMK